MDTSIKLRPLEPASGQALARDLVLKTRRRKGLGDQIAVSKYLDDEFVVSCRFVTLSHYPDPGAALGPGMIFVHRMMLTRHYLQLALSASGHADLLG